MSHFVLTQTPKPKHEQWWAPLWRGLIVSKGRAHYERMHSAIWLFAYLLLHADRKTGTLIRKLDTIARDMEIKQRTIRYWFMILRKHGYVTTIHTGSSLHITIHKWKPLQPSRPANNQ